MGDFFPLVKSYWKIEGDIIVKTNGIVLTAEDTAESVGTRILHASLLLFFLFLPPPCYSNAAVGLTDGTDVVVTRVAGSAPAPPPAAAAPPGKPPVARVLDLEAASAPQGSSLLFLP